MDRSDSKWKSNVNQEDSVAKFAVFRSTHLVRLRRVAKSEATSSSTHEPRWIFHTNGSRSINHDHTELDNRPSTERMRWESIQSAGRRFRADIIERQRISMLPFRVSCLPLPNQLEILFQLTATHTHTHTWSMRINYRWNHERPADRNRPTPVVDCRQPAIASQPDRLFLFILGL